jgi:hypothetical protein
MHGPAPEHEGFPSSLKWLRIIEESVLEGEQGGGRSGRHADLGVDVLHVVADSLLRDAQ